MKFSDFLKVGDEELVFEEFKTDEAGIKNLRDKYNQLIDGKTDSLNKIGKLNSERTALLFKLGFLASQITPETVDNDKLNIEIENYAKELEIIDKKLEKLYKEQEPVNAEIKRIEKIAGNLVKRNAKRAGLEPLTYVLKHDLSF